MSKATHKFVNHNGHNAGQSIPLHDDLPSGGLGVALITKRESVTRGLNFYYTGQPCKNGHVAPRYVKGGSCAVCRASARYDDKDHWSHKRSPCVALYGVKGRFIVYDNALRSNTSKSHALQTTPAPDVVQQLVSRINQLETTVALLQAKLETPPSDQFVF